MGAWTTVYEGPDPLATPQNYTVVDSNLVTAVRVTYTKGGCIYGPFVGVVGGQFSHDTGDSYDDSEG